MSEAIVSPEAMRDIRLIIEHVATDDWAAAEAILADIDRAIALLADMPGAGHVRPDLTTRTVRFWPVRRIYLVVYQEHADAIEIVRVLDGRRDVAALIG